MYRKLKETLNYSCTIKEKMITEPQNNHLIAMQGNENQYRVIRKPKGNIIDPPYLKKDAMRTDVRRYKSKSAGRPGTKRKMIVRKK